MKKIYILKAESSRCNCRQRSPRYFYTDRVFYYDYPKYTGEALFYFEKRETALFYLISSPALNLVNSSLKIKKIRKHFCTRNDITTDRIIYDSDSQLTNNDQVVGRRITTRASVGQIKSFLNCVNEFDKELGEMPDFGLYDTYMFYLDEAEVL